MEEVFLFVLGGLWLLFASAQDLKKREVADWISFSLIIFALGFRFFFSLFSEQWLFFLYGLIGLGIFVVLGNILYNARVFAGGDAKIMMAMGAVLGVGEFMTFVKIYALFFVMFFLVGAFYGLIYSFFLSIKNYKTFSSEFSKLLKKNKKLFFKFFYISLVLAVAGFFESLFFIFAGFIFAYFFFFIFAKSVEESSMVKEIKTSELTEGDWLYKSLKVKGETIRSKWEGLNSEEIKLIRKKYKKIKIKQGIAFVPVFLIAYFLVFLIQNFWIEMWNLFL